MTRKEIEKLLLDNPNSLDKIIQEIKASCWCSVAVCRGLLIVADYDFQGLEVIPIPIAPAIAEIDAL